MRNFWQRQTLPEPGSWDVVSTQSGWFVRPAGNLIGRMAEAWKAACRTPAPKFIITTPRMLRIIRSLKRGR